MPESVPFLISDHINAVCLEFLSSTVLCICTVSLYQQHYMMLAGNYGDVIMDV